MKMLLIRHDIDDKARVNNIIHDSTVIQWQYVRNFIEKELYRKYLEDIEVLLNEVFRVNKIEIYCIQNKKDDVKCIFLIVNSENFKVEKYGDVL